MKTSTVLAHHMPNAGQKISELAINLGQSSAGEIQAIYQGVINLREFK